MSIQTMTNCALIIIGAIIMLISIIQAEGLKKSMPFVPERHRKRVRMYLRFHRGLMVFFLIGYLVVMAAFAMRYSLHSETFISLIFLFGAIFVFIGVAVQSRLLDEVQQTIQGILPICAKCKKIRVADGDPKDPNMWKRIEAYISERVDVAFSHGYCPKCFDEEMKKIDSLKG